MSLILIADKTKEKEREALNGIHLPNTQIPLLIFPPSFHSFNPDPINNMQIFPFNQI
ncbi:hypothetical protein M8C21_013800 [Ambrosia artemisiifolia]|uniref:Uncharacterized protein n=1 Tax=Ambrosia artemisiifolia TaxID=4212 RepID=A0AAD5CM78_AMBAR|nr:hypothetical protein M8C21_013800 [Ambrosia artemisiifolia]